MKSSKASSAQWMSSNTSTVGPSSASASNEPTPRRKRLHLAALTAAGERVESDQWAQLARHPVAITLIQNHPRHRLGQLLLGNVAPSRIQGSPPAP